MSNVQDLLQMSWSVKLKHYVRDAKLSADFMAKLGATNSEI